MAEDLTDRGRPIYGPTLPGQGPPCTRQSPLTGAEVAEVTAVIAVDESLGRPGSGLAGAASDEIRRAERLPSPSLDIIYAHTIFPRKVCAFSHQPVLTTLTETGPSRRLGHT
jgi:hypothetical protein